VYHTTRTLSERSPPPPACEKAPAFPMSARPSRRAHAAAYGALPSVPIAEIRTRKWTKQLKTVGHLLIPKWIPGAAAGSSSATGPGRAGD